MSSANDRETALGLADFLRANQAVILSAWTERIGTLPAAESSLATRGTRVIEWLAESLLERPLVLELPVDESFSAPRAIAELTLLMETIAGFRPTSDDHEGRDALHRVVDRAIAQSLARDSDEAARLRKRLRLASHVTLVGSWQLDPATGTVEIDARARELFSVLEDDQPTLAALTSRLHADDREEVRAGIAQTITSQSAYKVECRTLRPVAGSLRWIAIATEAHAGLGAKGPVVLGIVYDVTASKRAEEDHARLVEELSRAVHISEMFVGILSHDLRNPLNAILGGAQMLGFGATDPRATRVLGLIRSSGDRMVRMIDQLLDFTRARLGEGIPLRPESADLAQLAHDVVEEVKSASSNQTLRVAVTGDTVGDWDRDRLSQILSNLVGNAVAHAAAGGFIEVVVDGTAADRVVVSTVNLGVIPKHVLPVLFNPFRGTIQKQGSSSGLGLGLYIARQIALAHGGELTVEVTETTTSFKLDLPRKERRSAPSRNEQVREEELAAFERLSTPPSLNNVTAKMFGATPLDERAPVEHAEMVARYHALLDAALQRQAYRGDSGRLGEELRALADRLGELNAGPREVTDVHARALRSAVRGATAAKTQAMLSEGETARAGADGPPRELLPPAQSRERREPATRVSRMTTKYEFDLFVVGGSLKAQTAEENLRRLCDGTLGGRYELRVIDVLENAEAAEAANIVATPALVRRSPLPVRIIVGDLSEPSWLAIGLGLEVDAESEGKPNDE